MAEKKTTITYKTTPKPAEGLAQVLAETERTIQELTRMFADSASSKHIGAGGKLKLTPQQEAIQKQLADAQARHERILKILENQ